MPKRYELPDLRPCDLVRMTNPQGGESLMYVNAQGRGHWVHFRRSRTIDRFTRPGAGWDLRDHEGDYTELGRLRNIGPSDVAHDWPRIQDALRAADPLQVTWEDARPPGPKVGDVLTREQVAALPAGAVTQDLVENNPYIKQWDGSGRGRIVAVRVDRLGEALYAAFDERPRPARLVALGTPLEDREAFYWSLADQGFKPAVEALAGVSRPKLTPAKVEASVEISATGTMVQVGDTVETTQEALTALPIGAVVHLWDPNGWKACARQTPGGLRWPLYGGTAKPWGIPGRQAVVVALDCPDNESAVKAHDAFLARAYKGQEQGAAMAAMVEARITTEVRAALDQVSDAGLNDQTISAVAGVVARSPSQLQAFTEKEGVEVQEWFNKILAEPTAIEYREAMPEIKSTMKLDLRTETLSIDVPRLPGETENAYFMRAAAIVKPQTPAPAPSLGYEVMMQAEPTWLERAAEALKPVAAELAAEAKAQTRQAIALGGVEVARAAAHRGIAAAAQALAPQHAAKVTQIVDSPFTRWLENGALFLGARAAGRPALAQVGLREVVRTPMEGAVGLLVQAASQVVGAVKGALVVADEAARVEQMNGQPEAAQVSAGEVQS